MASRTRTPGAKPPVQPVTDDDTIDPDLPEVIDEDGTNEVHRANGAVEESVESLREQRDAANRRAEAAELLASSTTKQVERAQRSVAESNKAAIENAITGEESSKRELMGQIKQAKEAGDYDKELELTDKLQQSNVRLNRLTEGKNEIDRRIEDEKNMPVDPVDRYVQGMDPKPTAWIKAHPEFVTDPIKRGKLERAHAHAVGEELVPGTDAYFDHVEQRLGLKAADTQQQHQPEERQVTQQRPPAAPPSRSVDGGGNSMSLPRGVEQLADGRYRLSPERREAARISGLSDGDYLKNLLAIERENQALN